MQTALSAKLLLLAGFAIWSQQAVFHSDWKVQGRERFGNKVMDGTSPQTYTIICLGSPHTMNLLRQLK